MKQAPHILYNIRMFEKDKHKLNKFLTNADFSIPGKDGVPIS